MALGLRSRPLSLLAAASLALLNCDDARPVIPLAEKVAAAFCAHQFACCSPFEISTVTSDRYTTEAECLPFATLAARQQLGAIQGAVLEGRISMDAAKANDCVKKYRDRHCNTSVQHPEAISAVPNVADVLAFCPDLLVGHVPNDRPCTLAQECLPGSRCVSGTPPVTPGLPVAPEASLMGNPGICVPYQKVGERCNESSDCDAARFACRTPEFVCGMPGQEGEPCSVELDLFTGQITSTCDASRGLYCDNIVGAACRRYPRRDEFCNFNSDTQCDPDPTLALQCNPFTSTCQGPGREGDPCGAPAISPCRDDLACHPTQRDGIGVCGALPVLGETCVDRCASPAVCLSGTCARPGALPLGARCNVNADCASLSCTGFMSTALTCTPSFNVSPRCVGAGVTQGNIEGGGGSSGVGGTFGTGGAPGGTGIAGSIGTGGMGGGAAPGCPFSNIAPGDPLIADFSMATDGTPVLPIGGTFTYGMPSPIATVTNGAWHITLTAPGTGSAQYLGVGIYFNANPEGTACTDASAHTGVQFDISGAIGGTGCNAHYSTNDSVHSASFSDPKGSGDATSYAPQAPFVVTATPVTLMMPFTGTGAPVGGSPPIPVDRTRLTGVQWQFTVAQGPANNCAVDITIDNVKFF